MLIGREIRSRLRSGLGFGDLLEVFGIKLSVNESVEWDMGK